MGRHQPCGIEPGGRNCYNTPHEKKVARQEEPLSGLEAAVAYAKANGRVSVSHLQRGMGIGYSYAAALLDEMVARGFVGHCVTKSTWEWRGE